MIAHPTVFVIGAGASEPYGLPLGGQLKQNILDRYTHSAEYIDQFTMITPFSRGHIKEFVNALSYSGLSSVDAFLERRPEFMEIGKSMMGIELLESENPERLWQSDKNWLAYLYGNMVGSTLADFAENRVAFVSFNYDRCIEHFFFTSLLNSFGRSPEETAATLAKIKVVHLHGRLGLLPWEGTNSLTFGSVEISASVVKVLTRAIKVVHEDHTSDGRDADFKFAEVMLVQARRVYLLGFGFGVRNVQRLKLEHLNPNAFLGTAYGLTDRERGNCQTLCGGKANLLPMQCLEFMRNSVDFS